METNTSSIGTLQNQQSKTNLFNFAVIRTPELLDDSQKIFNFILHPYLAQSSFLSGLSNLSVPMPANQMSTVVDAFTPISNLENLKQEVKNIYDFRDYIIRGLVTYTTVDFSEFLQKNDIKPLTKAKIILIWDNLFYQIINSESAKLREEIIKVILFNNIIELHEQEKIINNDNFKKLSNARVIIPKAIIKQREEPQPNANTVLSTGSSPQDILLQYDNAISELNQLKKEEGKKQIDSLLKTKIFKNNTSEQTQNLVKSSLEGTETLNRAISILAKENQKLQLDVLSKAEFSKKVVITEGSIFEIESSDMLLEGSENLTLLAEQQCQGVTNLGIADYMKVEQELCCYVPGEVSHIENIMQGEYKERSTRKLRRSELTTTFSSETESEELNDTTTTSRFELEQETAKVIQRDTSFDIGVTASTKIGPVKLGAKSNFATSSSTNESNKQASEYAKEVTERALKRVVTKVREERVNRIIEEYEENNKHGLDNRNNQAGHVTGVYRWVDKIYKNQVVNYGKRLMLEFMVPEPAKFHLWALTKKTETGVSIEKPIDPKDLEFALNSAADINESNYLFYSSGYGVEIAPPPQSEIILSKVYSPEQSLFSSQRATIAYNDYTVPEGYLGTDVTMVTHFSKDQPKFTLIILIGTKGHYITEDNTTNVAFMSMDNIEGTIPVSISTDKIINAQVEVKLTCKLKDSELVKWKVDAYNKIINVYQQKKAIYENDLNNALRDSSIQSNPLYNRITERQELKKGCLQWLKANVGDGFYSQSNPEELPEFTTSKDLACYASASKFFEQAFDWDIMSYLFYAYYWGDRQNWKALHTKDNNDPTYRGFLQAGMARVVVPVDPNYEDAITYYLETGEIWNGGQVPTIDDNDELYVSIVEDLQLQEPRPVGEPWETRVPTSLTILQAKSAAVSGEGLPCFCDDKTTEGTGDSTLEGNSTPGIGEFVIS